MSARQALLVVFLTASVLILACRKHTSSNIFLPPDPPGGGDTIPTNPIDTTGTDTTENNHPAIAYNQVAVHESVSGNVGGYYQALPLNYDSTTDKYPLLLFLHGGGELGNGDEYQLPLVLKNSLTKRLDQKNFPVKFTVEGVDYSFIIISPQFKEWPKVEDVNTVLNHMLKKYRVDSSRVYLSGLSMGGGVTWEYAGSKYGKRVAAVVPMCGASWADTPVARQIAYNDVPAWAFHNEDDSVVTVNSTKRYARLANAEHPEIPVRVTLWPVGGHDAWTRASDPEYREEGKNIYEWMLQFRR